MGHFYEEFAEEFDTYMNKYDLHVRLRLVFEHLLAGENLRGAKLLDAGCGTGWFSREAVEAGAEVISLDVGPKLLDAVRRKCNAIREVGSLMDLPFKDQAFDYIVCTEVIEHIPDPGRGIEELARVLKHGGVLALTTPNRVWHWAVRFANRLHLRRYEGLENWLSYTDLRTCLDGNGLSVDVYRGFHLFPFTFSPTHPLLRWCDRHCQWLAPFMVNVAARCIKT